MRIDRFTDKGVVIAGGASGMGAASAEKFVREGARIVIGDIQDERGEALAARLRAQGGQARYIHADCTDPADVARLIATASEELGAIDIAVNVLGGGAADDRPGTSIHDTRLETFRRTMAISLESVFLLMAEEVRVMMPRGRGAIVNVSSMAALAAERHAPMAYGVAKAALNHMTRSAASDYARHGIRINAILPGTTSTPMLHAIFDEAQVRQMLAGQQAIQTLLEPEDQADAILFLASEEARLITGVLMPVDGGRSAFGLQGPPASAVAQALAERG
jgi:NAD(P)-dependent dehydrogenase (short-subunit alcohol dehydrogenase family)